MPAPTQKNIPSATAAPNLQDADQLLKEVQEQLARHLNKCRKEHLAAHEKAAKFHAPDDVISGIHEIVVEAGPVGIKASKLQLVFHDPVAVIKARKHLVEQGLINEETKGTRVTLYPVETEVAA